MTSEYFLPGFKGGGSVQTINNIINSMTNEFDFYLITRDHDLGEKFPYPQIIPYKWNHNFKANIFYCSDKKNSYFTIFHILKNNSFCFLYLNSFFSMKFTLFPLILIKFKIINYKNVLVAPRGEFSNESLKNRRLSKKLFLFVIKLLKIYEKCVFQVSSNYERVDVEKNFQANISIITTLDLPNTSNNNLFGSKLMKKPGELKLIFIGRIEPIKNLDGAINILSNIKSGIIELSIYGPFSNKKYLKELKKSINNLPENVKIYINGPIDHQKISEAFSRNHFLYFLSKGENFGHVILESLLNITPVIISDLTPWRNLTEMNIGWDLSLNNPEKIISLIENLITLNDEIYQKMVESTKKYMIDYLNGNNLIKKYYNLFKYLC